VFTRDAGRQFGEDEVQSLEEVVERAAPAIENARRFRETRQLADLDALTGMHNRRYFYEALDREVSRARRYARPLALIVIDLDGFKAVNDRLGHLGGDEVLAVTSDRIRRVVRRADIACRIGGDEFAVILPESEADDAHQLFARVEEAIAEAPIASAEHLGVSAGIAELRPADKPIDLFDAADEALYRAKQAGRAQSVTASRPA
jgi:diguanylate cyclase (GGDEF)-like protein